MNPDDPKFTAHALGEIEDLTPAERAEIEALLASDPAAAAEADEMRSLAARLRAELPGEEAGALKEEQRAAVFSAAAGPASAEKIVPFPWGRRLAQIAALLLVTGVAAVMLTPAGTSKNGSSRLAKEATTEAPAPVTDSPTDLSGLIAINPEPLPASPALPSAALTPKEIVASVAPAQPLMEGEKQPAFAMASQMPAAPSKSVSVDNSPGAESERRLIETVTTFPTTLSIPTAPEVSLEPVPGNAPVGGRLAFNATDKTKASKDNLGRVESYEGISMATSSITGTGAKPVAEAATRGRMELQPSPAAVPSSPASPVALSQVDVAWARPIRRFNATPAPSTSATPADFGMASGATSGDRAGVAASTSGQLTVSDPTSATPSLPPDALADAKRAKQLFDAGRYVEASKLYAQIDKSFPENLYLLSNLGVSRFREGKFAQATDVLKTAVALEPKDAFALTGLGIAYYSQSKYDEAVNALTKALALNPKNAMAHNYLGITASQKGWKDAAIKELETAVALDPAYSDSHFNLAVTLVMQNPANKGKAAWHYWRAIALGAEPDQALEQLIGKPDPQTAASFDELAENAFLSARENPLSTFSTDVDTASYSMVRRFLNNNQRPAKGSVRIEELLNYFPYEYAQPEGDVPFSAAMEVAACPWTPEHRLVRIGLKGRDIANDKRPASNLVFLIDVSGSMRPDNKLPLLKQSLGLLVDQLGEEDQVSIVVYAGNSGCVLEPTNNKRKMRDALRNLEAGGSTNGGSGVQLAYKLAEKSFIKGGTNRVILATDGDWNVGVTDRNELIDLIKRKAKSGVFLTVLGVGMDNLKDATLVKLADSGNGNYAYLDTVAEAKKVLVQQLSGTLVTIAKDVKIQVEFNPAQVGSYRLIGYEKRLLAKEDFNNDKKDAGEIGAGHTVTALYEVVPAGQIIIAKRKPVDTLKYQPEGAPAPAPAPVVEETSIVTAKDPGDVFVSAYMAVQQGEKYEQSGILDKAVERFEFAAKLLNQITATWPSWQPQIAEYRKKRIADALVRMQQKIEGFGPNGAVLVPEDDQKVGLKKSPAEVEQQVVESALVAPRLAESKANVAQKPVVAASQELLTLKLRYKEPEGDTSKLLEFPLIDRGTPWEKSSGEFRFAAAVAGYGMLLRDSQFAGEATWSAVTEWAEEGKGKDASGYRAEFLGLIEKAREVCR